MACPILLRMGHFHHITTSTTNAAHIEMRGCAQQQDRWCCDSLLVTNLLQMSCAPTQRTHSFHTGTPSESLSNDGPYAPCGGDTHTHTHTHTHTATTETETPGFATCAWANTHTEKALFSECTHTHTQRERERGVGEVEGHTQSWFQGQGH